MDYTTVLPDATPLITGAAPVGAASAHAATSDTSDGTYVKFDVTNEHMRLSFADYVLASNQRIWGVYMVGRERLIGLGASGSMNSRIGPSTVTSGHLSGLQGTWVGGWADYYSAWHNKDWTGVEWTQAQINATFTYFTCIIASGAIDVSKVSLGFGLVTQPTATVVSPGSGSTNVSKSPLVQWAYSGFGEAQWKYRVKIFTQAVAEGAGFDPATAATVYDSAEITSSATSHQIPANTLAHNTVYYVSVQVNKNMNFFGATGLAAYYSPWAASTAFTTNSIPVVAVTGPADTDAGTVGVQVTNTNLPIVAWTFTDTESDIQVAYEVRTFTAAQYGIGGFDPATSPATDTSGVVASTALSYKIVTPLANATYRSYVRARQTVDSAWSLWAYREYTVNIVAPLAPVMGATASEVLGRILVTITRNAAGVQPEFFRIERSFDGGVTWTILRNVVGNQPMVGFTVYEFSDYEVPPNKQVTYRGFVYEQTLDDLVVSASTTVQLTLTVKKIWVRDPIDSASNVQFPVEDVWLPRSRTRLRAVHRPVGRILPVVVRSEGSGESFPMTFVCIGETRFNQLLSLLDRNRTLLVSSSKRNWYVDVMSTEISEHLWDELRNEGDWAMKVTVQFQEVSAP